jgi:RNA polymerase II subunit A small phosphatase-like protein
MGRALERIAIVDNSPVAYSFHPDNAIAIESWFGDRSDRALLELMPTVEHYAHTGDIARTRRHFRLK